jgi:hypothetical protein
MDPIDRELDEIMSGSDEQTIHPADVVEFAKDPSTALHKRFEWDDGKAAHQYRVWQAREIINARMVVLDDGKGGRHAVRAYVSLTTDRDAGGYRKTSDVIGNDAMRERLLADCRSDLRRVKKKYEHFRHVAEAMKKVFTLIE